jgi:Beta-ketoacyl synthase, C-terminal domain/Beta-ketoacyl synthase, N-terminal domain
MSPTADHFPIGIEAGGCLTPFGGAEATLAALLAGERALQLRPVLGAAGGDRVPLALLGSMEETLPPRWLPALRELAASIPGDAWGSPRCPVVVTSSNFGVGSLYAYLGGHDPRHLAHGAPCLCVELLQREFGWGGQVHTFSHACVTAHLGLMHATRLLQAGLADRVLVFTFDFVSPFVAGGFHSLKILNSALPAPYAARATGSIGLGDGAAFAVLTREATPFRIEAQALHNEMHHFTSNQADGAGFAVCAEAIAAAAGGRKLWIKGHGTGTLDAGRLESEAYARAFPGAPLVSWKGSLGHTLGSCGLVELALTMNALSGGRVPGTVGTEGPCFTDTVAVAPFAATDYEGAVVASNAFGGAHAALLLSHA